MSVNKKKNFGGFKLPGMVAVDKSVSSGLSLSEKLESLLRFSTTHFVRATVVKSTIDGERIDAQGSQAPESKLGEVRRLCSNGKGGFFVLFGNESAGKSSSQLVPMSEKKILLVSYIPETTKVKEKMLLASSKGVLKKKVAELNPNVMIEEYNCSELKELSEEIYNKKKNVEKPFSEAEKLRMQEDAMEKVGGDNIIARLRDLDTNAPGYSLPGFGIGMKPSEVKKDRIQSMNVAREKDNQRKAKVDFLLKLKEEKEKMEAEEKEKAENTGIKAKMEQMRLQKQQQSGSGEKLATSSADKRVERSHESGPSSLNFDNMPESQPPPVPDNLNVIDRNAEEESSDGGSSDDDN